jgi:hypothetical protein
VRLRRHHVWLLVGFVLMLVGWFAWSALLVESDLAR